jgi:hypothetical protein
VYGVPKISGRWLLMKIAGMAKIGSINVTEFFASNFEF